MRSTTTTVEPLSCCCLCFLEGDFLDGLNISRICQIFKKGPKDKPESYWPISIIPTVSKLFYLIFCDQIGTYFEPDNLLGFSRFEFRTGKSTTNAIDKLDEEVLKAFENMSLLKLHCVT